jgi:hypothetical protein
MGTLSVNLVVACTDKKSRRPAPELQLRRYRTLALPKRVDAWTAALRESDAAEVPAMDLYLGDHWQVAKALRTAPPAGVAPRLWVMSAGYGLVDGDKRIRAYSATFATGHADSVVNSAESDAAGDVTAAWWAGLTAAAPSQGARRSVKGAAERPRSLTELAEANPATPMLVVGSHAYLVAVAGDLLIAAAQLRSSELLSVFSTGGNGVSALQCHRIPYDGRLQAPDPRTDRSYLGGAYPSLNVRAAGEALRVAAATRLRCPALQEHFARLMELQPPLREYDRTPATPDEVADFIRQALVRDPSAKHTRLLRDFRDGGHAFEYTRFKRVFEQVKAQLGQGRREEQQELLSA